MSSEPSASNFAILDYYIPSDLITFPPIPPQTKPGLCPNDEDLGSGGVLLPPNYQYTGNIDQCSAGCNVVINADKQSNLYVTNQKSLGGYVGSSSTACPGNNLQCITTPAIPANNPTQGYWASPAYWFDGSNSWLYYAATINGPALLCPPPPKNPCSNGYGPPGVSPEALNAYKLQPSGDPGPIPSATPYASSGTSNPYPILFCDYSPTPSVSSNQNSAASGIVWAIERNQNNDNLPNHNPQDCAPPANGSGGHPRGNPAALHAFCAEAGSQECPTALTEIYTSRILKINLPAQAHAFPTPTVFNGQVYMGTDKEIDVFGLCSSQSGGCLK
jgi:hypothetical protein